MLNIGFTENILRVIVHFVATKKMLFGRKLLPLHRFLDYCACSACVWRGANLNALIQINNNI